MSTDSELQHIKNTEINSVYSFYYLDIAIRTKQLEAAEKIVTSALELLKDRSVLEKYIRFEQLITSEKCDREDYEKFLIQFLDLNEDNTYDELIIAMIRGNLDSAISLLQAMDSVSLDQENMLATLALSRRNINVRKKMLELLIKKGLNVNKVYNNEENNLLHIFLQDYANKKDEDLMDIVKMLIDSGVDLHEAGYCDHTALHTAIRLQSKSLVKFFVEEQGFDVNAKTVAGFFPLRMAVKFFDGEDLDIIEFLVSKGAEIDSKDCYGKTALDLAKSEDKTSFVDYLIGVGADS